MRSAFTIVFLFLLGILIYSIARADIQYLPTCPQTPPTSHQIYCPTPAPIPVPITNTKSMEFDGVDEYVDCGNIASFERTDPFSLSIWFKTSFAGSNLLLSKRDVVAERGWSFWLWSGNFYFILENWGSGGDRLYVRYTAVNYADGAWHHTALTYDGSSSASGVHLYVDSSDKTLDTVLDGLTGTTITAVTCQIGAHNSIDTMNGKIDEVSIYTSELSSADVNEIYNSGVPMTLSTLTSWSTALAWWRMGDKFTVWPTIPDQKTSNNGTAINMNELTDVVSDVPP